MIAPFMAMMGGEIIDQDLFIWGVEAARRQSEKLEKTRCLQDIKKQFAIQIHLSTEWPRQDYPVQNLEEIQAKVDHSK